MLIDCKSIYLVDDDPDDVAVFLEAVHTVDPSVSVDTCSSCEAAINFLNQQEGNIPDLIFLDLNLPGMTGKQCLIELRKIEKLRDIPIIIYTTSDHSRDVEDTLKLGASYFLTKPGNFKVLCTILERLLKKYPFFVRFLKQKFQAEI